MFGLDARLGASRDLLLVIGVAALVCGLSVVVAGVERTLPATMPAPTTDARPALLPRPMPGPSAAPGPARPPARTLYQGEGGRDLAPERAGRDPRAVLVETARSLRRHRSREIGNTLAPGD
jgi:hypothetical protein